MIHKVSEPTWRGRWLAPLGPSWRVHRWSWWSHRLATASPPMDHLHTSKEIIYYWISAGTDANMCRVILRKHRPCLGVSADTSNRVGALINRAVLKRILCIPFLCQQLEIEYALAQLSAWNSAAHWLLRFLITACVCADTGAGRWLGPVRSGLAVIWQSSDQPKYTYRKITN